MNNGSADQYQHLADLAEKVANSPMGRIGITNYTVPEGIIRGYGILNVPAGETDLEPGGAVQYCYMREGESFPEHVQPHITEWLIMIDGQLEVQAGGEPALLLAPGDGLRIPPGVPHTARAFTDCLVVGITIPRDGGYPDGPEPAGHPGDACSGVRANGR